MSETIYLLGRETSADSVPSPPSAVEIGTYAHQKVHLPWRTSVLTWMEQILHHGTKWLPGYLRLLSLIWGCMIVQTSESS
jgi:hypothetical protein